MKLRTKAILFFGSFLLFGVLLAVLYSQYVVGDALRKQIINSIRISAEHAQASYHTFLKVIRRGTIDWTANHELQSIAERLVESNEGTSSRRRAAEDFASFVINEEMPYDKSVLMADILDKNGIVIASTIPARIGTDELSEEILINAHDFSRAIVSKFGETFIKSIVFEEDESSEPMIHAAVRVFKKGTDGILRPLDAVLLIHYSNANEIGKVLSGEKLDDEQLALSSAFISRYRSSEIYMVNMEKKMVTPSRFSPDVNNQKVVDTLPVRECIENNRGVNDEYDDYRGARVFGASVCLRDDGLVLLVEIDKDEVFEPLASLARTTIFIGEVVLALGILIIVRFLKRPLGRIDEVISALEKVMKGDLSVQMVVRTRDEIGHLASMFNTMVDSIRRTQKDLRESKEEVEKKALILERDVKEHEKQEKFLEESKVATLNLLEDSWKAKEKLEEEGTRLQTILASIGDGLVLIDPQYKVVLVNKRAVEIFAMSEDEILQHDLREVANFTRRKMPLDPKEWPTEEMFRTKKTVVTSLEDSLSISTKGREKELPVSLSVAPLTGRFHGAVIVIRDIAGDYALDEAKSGFISVASHQLRTPLTSIRWYSEMLLSEDAGTLNDAQKDFMKEIHGGAERLYQTVGLLLGISRIESGKMKADRTQINLNEFTTEIAKEMKSQLDVKNLTLNITPPDREPVTVWLDSLTLRQVVLNLISNAISYTNKDGTIETKWWINEDGREVVVAVSDNGIGIPESQRSRIFSKFFRAENARAQSPDGTGLGLALVKDLVDSWGGRIWFETEEGKGTTFLFTVPFTTKVA